MFLRSQMFTECLTCCITKSTGCQFRVCIGCVCCVLSSVCSAACSHRVLSTPSGSDDPLPISHPCTPPTTALLCVFLACSLVPVFCLLLRFHIRVGPCRIYPSPPDLSHLSIMPWDPSVLPKTAGVGLLSWLMVTFKAKAFHFLL